MDSEQLKQPEHQAEVPEVTPSNIPEISTPMAAPEATGTASAPNSEPSEQPVVAESTTPATLESGLSLEEDLQAFARIKEDGTLLLKATPFSTERVLATLQSSTADAVLHSLKERFKDLAAKVDELAKEWEATEDKAKLGSKVARITDYLQHAVAIGDFLPLYQQAARWDNHLQGLTEKGIAAKRSIVEQAEAIANGAEVKDIIMTLRDLAERWKKIGHTDKDKDDELWKRLEVARDKIYEQRRLNHEAEIAELNNKLDLKMEIVEKAEQFAASEDWKDATEGFKVLLEQWKEIGHTFNDKNEALWQRFITAKNVFFDRKKQHYEVIHEEQEKNFEAKNLLVLDAEQLANSTEWNKTANAFDALMDKWKEIGRVPREKENELWDRLNKAKDIFYKAKRQHFATLKVTYDDNYAQKMALITRAEQLQRSMDWRNATDEFGELMEEWKKIGAVAREHSEPLWERFTKARRSFFDRKDADRDKRRAHYDRTQNDRISQTEAFLRQLKQEIKEDEENLADHHESLSKLGDSKIDRQIRANLEKLIEQSGPRVAKKLEKIAAVEAQLAELNAAKKGKQKGDKRDKADRNTPTTQPIERNFSESTSETISTENRPQEANTTAPEINTEIDGATQQTDALSN
ncbi:MAG: DUF349 domain-containing protein [Bacteroidetes bacterium]|nr:DUF349 domain-containing protein [Bacteroidota bacterium]